MVADAGTALGAAVAPELQTALGLDQLKVLRLLTGVLHQLAVIIPGDGVDVFMVDQMALGDGTVGLADQLAVLEDLGALVKIGQRDLVAVGDGLLGPERAELAVLAVGHFLARGDLLDTGDHIVGPSIIRALISIGSSSVFSVFWMALQ